MSIAPACKGIYIYIYIIYHSISSESTSTSYTVMQPSQARIILNLHIQLHLHHTRSHYIIQLHLHTRIHYLIWVHLQTDCTDMKVVIDHKRSKVILKSAVWMKLHLYHNSSHYPVFLLSQHPSELQWKQVTQQFKPKKVESKQLTKCDLIVAESTGNCKLVLWEGDISSMEINHSYIVQNITLRAFQNRGVGSNKKKWGGAYKLARSVGWCQKPLLLIAY